MKRKLTQEQAELLSNRIYLSRAKYFKLGELAKDWNLTEMTLYRYNSPKYREYSRKQARLKPYQPISTICKLCPKLLVGHIRCPDCTMLIHGEPECSCAMIRQFLNETL